MHRFFVKQPNWQGQKKGQEIKIDDPALVHQIKNVLRLKRGQEISIFDSTGQEYLMVLTDIQSSFVVSQLLKPIKSQIEPVIALNLYQALLKQNNWDWIIKHGTGLGITKFIPLITDRTIVRQISKNKIERWQKIAQEAAEQSGRIIIPEINQPIELTKLKIADEKSALYLVAWEEAKRELKNFLPVKEPSIINLLAGPEGGLAEKEIAALQKLGWQPFLFGPRILRAEFAGLAICSAIFYHYS